MPSIKIGLGILYCATTLCYAAERDNFTLSSPVVFNLGQLPPLYTCDGKNISPKLIWLDTPRKTLSFALIVKDPDAPAGTFYHWVLYDIPSDTTKLDEAVSILPTGTKVGMNSANKMAYFAPCPPKGPLHHYIFTVYALDTKLQLAAGVDAATLLTAMQNHIVKQADMTVLYGR